MIEILVGGVVCLTVLVAYLGWKVKDMREQQDFDWKAHQVKLKSMEIEINALASAIAGHSLPGPIRSNSDSTVAPAAGVWGDSAGGEG